ncbi:MAG: guanylate kinase [Oscillospiraceae bacterium]|jgi:guanylate kinase|nr:guanylate kinase [Oscillospiraceae bacterium]
MAKIFVISAPSGAGKKTIRERMMRDIPELRYSISMTTRAPRAEDIPGVTYDFVTQEEFEAAIAREEFIEWSFHLGNYYGTPRKAVEQHIANGEDVLLEIDTNGARYILKHYPKAVGIFIVSDNLERQLGERGTESPAEIAERLEKAKREMEESAMYKYKVVNRYGDLESAVAECEEIIKKERN